MPTAPVLMAVTVSSKWCGTQQQSEHCGEIHVTYMTEWACRI